MRNGVYLLEYKEIHVKRMCNKGVVCTLRYMRNGSLNKCTMEATKKSEIYGSHTQSNEAYSHAPKQEILYSKANVHIHTCIRTIKRKKK